MHEKSSNIMKNNIKAETNKILQDLDKTIEENNLKAREIKNTVCEYALKAGIEIPKEIEHLNL